MVSLTNKLINQVNQEFIFLRKTVVIRFLFQSHFRVFGKRPVNVQIKSQKSKHGIITEFSEFLYLSVYSKLK